jgi:hypothetical protein
MNCIVHTLGVNIYFLASLDKNYKNTECAGYVITFVLQVICTGLNLYYNGLEHTGEGAESTAMWEVVCRDSHLLNWSINIYYRCTVYTDELGRI